MVHNVSLYFKFQDLNPLAETIRDFTRAPMFIKPDSLTVMLTIIPQTLCISVWDTSEKSYLSNDSV